MVHSISEKDLQFSLHIMIVHTKVVIGKGSRVFLVFGLIRAMQVGIIVALNKDYDKVTPPSITYSSNID